MFTPAYLRQKISRNTHRVCASKMTLKQQTKRFTEKLLHPSRCCSKIVLLFYILRLRFYFLICVFSSFMLSVSFSFVWGFKIFFFRSGAPEFPLISYLIIIKLRCFLPASIILLSCLFIYLFTFFNQLMDLIVCLLLSWLPLNDIYYSTTLNLR